VISHPLKQYQLHSITSSTLPQRLNLAVRSLSFYTFLRVVALLYSKSFVKSLCLLHKMKTVTAIILQFSTLASIVIGKPHSLNRINKRLPQSFPPIPDSGWDYHSSDPKEHPTYGPVPPKPQKPPPIGALPAGCDEFAPSVECLKSMDNGGGKL